MKSTFPSPLPLLGLVNQFIVKSNADIKFSIISKWYDKPDLVTQGRDSENADIAFPQTNNLNTSHLVELSGNLFC